MHGDEFQLGGSDAVDESAKVLRIPPFATGGWAYQCISFSDRILPERLCISEKVFHVVGG